MKVVENSPQNARNCTIINFFFCGGMPPNPPSKRSQLRCLRHAAKKLHVYIKSQKFKSWAPPPPEKSCVSLFIIPSKYKPQRFNCSMFSKISPVAKYPIASVYLYKHYVLYKNMLFLGNVSIHNLIKIYFKTHQPSKQWRTVSLPNRIR